MTTISTFINLYAFLLFLSTDHSCTKPNHLQIIATPHPFEILLDI